MFFTSKVKSNSEASRERRINQLREKLVKLQRSVRELRDEYIDITERDSIYLLEAALSIINKKGAELEKEMYVTACLIKAYVAGDLAYTDKQMQREFKRQFNEFKEYGDILSISLTIEEQLKDMQR